MFKQTSISADYSHPMTHEQIAAHQSESSLNHLSGDSIVVDVLMAIFGEMI